MPSATAWPAALADTSTGSDKIVSYLSVREVRKLLYRIGAPAFKDRVLLKWAASPKGASAIQWRMLLAMGDAWERPRFPLTGREVMLAGACRKAPRSAAYWAKWKTGGSIAISPMTNSPSPSG